MQVLFFSKKVGFILWNFARFGLLVDEDRLHWALKDDDY